MTVEVYDGPGDESWRSSRFTATIAGSAAFVYGREHLTLYETEVWDEAELVEISWVTFGADAATTVVLGKTSGSVTSATVYPKDTGTTVTVAGGVCTLVIPANTRLRVEINDDRANVMHVFASPLKDALPASYTDWDDIPGPKPTSWTGSSPALYFGPGVHNIIVTPGTPFDLNANAEVYIDGGAVVIGNFDVRGVDGVRVHGPGVLSGSFATFEDVAAIPAGSQAPYTMFYGLDNAKWVHDNEVQGLTIVETPFWLTRLGVCSWRNVHVLSPWWWTTDGFDCTNRSALVPERIVEDCFAYVGDDALRAHPMLNAQWTISGCFFITTSNAAIRLGYWPEPIANTSMAFTDCHAMHLGIADTGGDDLFPYRGANAVVVCWIDGAATERAEGRGNVTFTNLNVWGPLACRLVCLQNRLYPYAGTAHAEAYGQIQDIEFDGFIVEETPGQLSLIEGKDRRNAPHRISFLDTEIEGVRLTAANFFDFFETNAFVYRLSASGVPVVTEVELCNRALARLGQQPRLTSIDPPDGSAEAELFATAFAPARDSLLDRHAWAFASKRAALVLYDADEDSDIDAWAYAYTIPNGMLRPLAVMPEGASDDLTLVSGEVPQNFVIELNSAGVQVLYTNEPDATLRFIAYVDDPGAFSPLFQEALVCFLAAEVAGPLIKGEAGIQQTARFMQLGEAALAKAAAADARHQRMRTSAYVPAALKARGASGRGIITGGIAP